MKNHPETLRLADREREHLLRGLRVIVEAELETKADAVGIQDHQELFDCAQSSLLEITPECSGSCSVRPSQRYSFAHPRASAIAVGLKRIPLSPG